MITKRKGWNGYPWSLARENIEGMHGLGTWLFSCTFCCLNREGNGKEME
jgi:hypothetical protein